MNLFESMKAVRRAGVPLVAIETAEPAGCVAIVCSVLNGKKDVPILVWNLMTGILPGNDKSRQIADTLNDQGDPLAITGRPDEMLRKAVNMPQDGMLILQGAEKIIEDINVRQGVWNLRDAYKTTGRTLVMFVTTGCKLPIDLKDDIVVLHHDLPNEERLGQMAVTLAEDANIGKITDDAKKVAIDATLGLSEFAAEQVLAMSLGKTGYDTQSLWERKRSSIEQTKGLSVWKGTESFDSIGGNDNVKSFMSKLVQGKEKPRCVVFIDEIEKAMAGQGDSSGTNQEMLGHTLKWMQDSGAVGVLFVGVCGGGKSVIAKSVGNLAECPTIEFDYGAMKGSLVGQSGSQLRDATAKVDAIGQGKILVIATCNKIESLPPELRRRFNLATFFFDLPNDAERQAIWKVWLDKYKINDPIPPCEGWTGAEIRQCCDIADRLGISLLEASGYVVPVAKSSVEAIESLRKSATGRYLSAAYKGVYTYSGQAQSVAVQGSKRTVDIT